MKSRTVLIGFLCLCFSCGLIAGETKILEEGAMMGEQFPQEILSRSLVSTGNNARMKAAIAKARSGKPVSIAYIGGSITEGANASAEEHCWAYASFAAFRDLFGTGTGDNVRFRNAGMSGTPSTLGMIRYRRDVIDRLESPPDIVFVEFAVNDGDDPTNGAAYESLVLDIMRAENHPAVVLLFSVFQSRWNLQDRLMPVGRAYGLPMISIRDAVVPELEAGRITDAQFFSDIYHPGDWGHSLMTACVVNYFRAVDAEPPAASDAPMPHVPAIGDRFAGISLIDRDHLPSVVSIASGSFSEIDQALGTVRYEPALRTFPANWHKAEGSENAPFVMTLECRSLFLVYKKSSAGTAFGEAEVYVDGELVDAFDGLPRNGWNNPWTSVLIDDTTSARHTVTVKMADGSEKSAFSILAFGYVR